MTRTIPAVVLLALVSGSLLPACSRPADPAQMATVEQLIQQTESMRTQLNSMDTNALRHMGSLFEAERPSIEQRFRDTLLPHEAEVLGNYHRAMAERLPRLMDERRSALGRTDSTLLRLRDLRHDLRNGLLSKNGRRNALAMEQRWNNALRDELDLVTDHTKALIRERTTYRAAIDSLLRQ
ncbi:MAG: hypothetical protein KDC01_08380 [Flavobacteriales bacterium]|jgi:hypothetical protein|nr:hypothetical protein [Flavobacteriales bacterium]